MPFDVNLNYGSPQSGQLQHGSVPANGRRTVTADFAILYVNNQSVGLVQRFSPSESRPVAPQYEIGNLYPAEFIPQPWSGRISVQKLEIFKLPLFAAFGFNTGITQYGLAPFWPSDKRDSSGNPICTTLADIQWPMDLSLHITNPAITTSITVKTYVECWITEFGTSYDAGAKVVAENVSFTYRTTSYSDVDYSTYNLQALTNSSSF